MIFKLRVRFIRIAMFSFAFILFLVLGIINALNYLDIVADADATLNLLKVNNGAFPEFGSFHRGDYPSRLSSPEARFENRFFSVGLDEEGAVCMVDTDQIAAIDDQTAIEYATAVFKSRSLSGSRGDYRYAVQIMDDDVSIIVFLDMGRSIAGFHSYLNTCILLYACALTAVFVLLAFLSKRIVRPISESYEKQKQFVTNAGHDIKTPLTIIDADAEVLSLELGENEWVQDIKIQAKHLSILTASLISMAKMEEPDEVLHKIDFPISDIMTELGQSFQSIAKVQGKELVCDIQPMLSFYGDEKSLRQLTSILLDNALKYSDAASLISMRLERRPRTLILSISNHCEPIRPEQLSRLFDRFYRLDSARTSGDGYGIGLSIAKAVTEAHRGKISAASHGRILTITVSLPIAKKSSALTTEECSSE